MGSSFLFACFSSADTDHISIKYGTGVVHLKVLRKIKFFFFISVRNDPCFTRRCWISQKLLNT